VQALLENLKRIASEPASNDELDTARRFLADVFAVRMETVGAVADMVVSLRVLGLPEDYYDVYRKEIRVITAEKAEHSIAEHLREGHAVIAVAGDAERIAPVLSHFGDRDHLQPGKRIRARPLRSGESPGSHRAHARSRSVVASHALRCRW